MRFLLPLLLLTVSSYAQYDTTYLVSGFYRTTSVYSFENKPKGMSTDSGSFAGAFLKMEKRGNLYYLPAVLKDTLIRVVSNINSVYDTIKGTCGPGGILIDTIVERKTEGIAFNKGIVGFYTQEPVICPNKAAIDRLFIYYPETQIPEKSTPMRYWDYKIVSIEIRVMRKQAAYSN